MTPPQASRDAGVESTDAVLVEEVLRGLGTALRSHRLYAGAAASVERFVVPIQQRLRRLWEHHDQLRLNVTAEGIAWEGRVLAPAGNEPGNLAFLLFKEGIRELTLLPGFEDEGIGPLLGVLARAPQLDPREDDLVSLLWVENPPHLRYQAVELVEEGAELHAGPAGPPPEVDPQAVRAEAGSAAAAPQHLGTDEFQDTLYFLSAGELEHLRRELRREEQRDLWGDVLNALFDRLEDGSSERQRRILDILRDLLPSLLGSGEFGRAADVLDELVELGNRGDVFEPALLRELRAVFQALAGERALEQLVQILDSAPERIRGDDLTRLLSFLPPTAVAPLMRAGDAVQRPDTRRLLERSVQRLVTEYPEQVVQLLRDPDARVAESAARWVQQLGVQSAAPALAGLLERAEPRVRVAAIEALCELRSAAAGPQLVDALRDEERDVRIAAARSLGTLGFESARAALLEEVRGKRLRAADRAEKLAFFEALGRLAGPDELELMDRLLNGRRLLGRTEPTEIRACAVAGLAQSELPEARRSLAAAANDSDPVVRTAVGRALRREGP